MHCMVYLLSVLWLTSAAEGARVLGIFPVPSVSHQVVYRKVMRTLHERGHEVVVVTTDPIADPPKNYTQIDIGPLSYKLFRQAFDFATMVGSNRPHPTTLVSNMMDFFCMLSEKQLNISEFASLFHSNENFDVMFLEWLITPVYLGFAHHFQVPVIGVASLSLMTSGYDTVGNPSNPAYLPDMMIGSFGKLSLLERVNAVYYELFYRLKYYLSHLKCQDQLSKKFFGPDTPHVGQLEKHVSIIMTNTHPVTGLARPLIPTIIEIGGPPVHLAESKPLPRDLQEFLDDAEDGVIYFSLGSNVKSSTMPESKRAMFLNAFRQIKQKVLWKWETDDLPGKPDNVKVQKWLPQTDVLAHPNVKVFMTQGGLQSMGEAIHFEKPMVVIPFFADQELNAKKLESVGVAVRLDFETMTEDGVLQALNEIISNSKYQENMVKYSQLTRDQPQSPMERAVWWTEYVLRHNGARHLRSSAVDMPWYQYFMLDVLGFLLAATLATLYTVYFTVRLTFRIIFRKAKTKKD